MRVESCGIEVVGPECAGCPMPDMDGPCIADATVDAQGVE